MSGRSVIHKRPATVTDDGEPTAVSVKFHDNFMFVYLEDGQYVSVPVTTYKRLREATPEQRAKVEVSPRGMSLHWEELDEDLSVSGLVRDFGAKPVEMARA